MKNARLKARYLRKYLTIHEKLLWKELRDRRFLNYKFRRQYPIDNYILDFYCPKAKLAIELDGSQHAEVDIAEYDRIRTIHLESYNIKVLRFLNNEVKKNLKEVLNTIFYNLETSNTKSK